MTKSAPTNDELEAMLERSHARLKAHEVVALYAGALCGSDLSFGPLQLMRDTFGDDADLGDNLESANRSLHALMNVWNALAHTDANTRMRLSSVAVTEPPTRSELAALAARRGNEVTWFLRGLDAGGGVQGAGERAEFLVRRLTSEADLSKTQLDKLRSMSDPAEGILPMERDNLDRMTGRIEELMTELICLSREARAEIIASLGGRAA